MRPSRRRVVQSVSRELRTPMLYVPLSLTGDVALRAARRIIRRRTEVAADVTHTVVAVSDCAGPEVHVYEPPGRGDNGGALVWVHGGGRVAGEVAGDHGLCSRLAVEAGVLVVSVDYRLAPEHPFPAALDDCMAALAWVHENVADLGVDLGRIAVGGASAGGGLAAELAQRAHDEGGPVAFQLLVYPMLDDRTLSLDAAGRGRLSWTPRSNRYAWGAHLGHPAGDHEERPYAVAARRADLRGLPPAWIGVGDLDLFHDEDVAYAQRLREAGVECELHVEPGMYHGADIALDPQPPSMAAFQHRMSDALARQVGRLANSSHPA